MKCVGGFGRCCRQIKAFRSHCMRLDQIACCRIEPLCHVPEGGRRALAIKNLNTTLPKRFYCSYSREPSRLALERPPFSHLDINETGIIVRHSAPPETTRHESARGWERATGWEAHTVDGHWEQGGAGPGPASTRPTTPESPSPLIATDIPQGARRMAHRCRSAPGRNPFASSPPLRIDYNRPDSVRRRSAPPSDPAPPSSRPGHP
jgi:hypothetical protein